MHVFINYRDCNKLHSKIPTTLILKLYYKRNIIFMYKDILLEEKKVFFK